MTDVISYGRKNRWDDSTGRWTVRTDRSDAMKARYVILANGLLTTPKLTRIDGMQSLRVSPFTLLGGYHVDLKDKRVGIIGTGAAAVQVVPEIAKVVKSLHVFQRTPSSVDVEISVKPLPRSVTHGLTSQVGRARRARFAKISAGRTAMQANDDYLAGKEGFKQRKSFDLN